MKRKLLNSETDKLQSIIEASNIPVTKSTKECIDAYLKDIKEEIGKNSPEISDDDSKMLFFTKMKRFIMTAYNNLYDMDSGFFDDKLRRLKDELFNLERILNDVHLRLVNLDNAYSNIFLQEQLNYILVERAIELNRDRISMYRSSEISLKRNLDLKEALFQKDPSNELLESEVKRIRKQYTDFSCEYSNVKDETKLLNQLRLQFKDRYLDEFTLGLSDKLSKLESLITNVLNHKAYDLDCDLWTKAKKSESIKKFFQLSKIEGTYSSKTYLKYFLKNLDDNLISEMQQELKDILLYLQEITEKDILIVGKNESRIESLHKLVENIDKDYVVKSFNRTFGALTYLHKVNVDLVILENKLSDMDAFEFIREFKEELPKRIDRVKFIIFVDVISKNIVTEFITLAVKPIFISSELSDEELIEKITGALK